MIGFIVIMQIRVGLFLFGFFLNGNLVFIFIMQDNKYLDMFDEYYFFIKWI